VYDIVLSNDVELHYGKGNSNGEIFVPYAQDSPQKTVTITIHTISQINYETRTVHVLKPRRAMCHTALYSNLRTR